MITPKSWVLPESWSVLSSFKFCFLYCMIKTIISLPPVSCILSRNMTVMKFWVREGRGGNWRTFKRLNNKINKHKRKAAAPHGGLPYTKHKIKSRPGPLSSFNVVTPPFILPKLLRGTRDRWVAQVSFIIIYSTGLAPFPWLSARPTRHNDRDRCSIILLVKEWSYLMSQLWDDELSLVYWEDERGWKLGFIWFRGRPNHHPLWFNPLNARLKIFRINIASNIA